MTSSRLTLERRNDMPLLKLENVAVSYGSIRALHGISMTVEKGEIVTLIGANGAGKTTTMKAITGLLPLNGGKIFYEDQDITSWKTKKRVASGIVLVPEGRQIFPRFSVKTNLDMGAFLVNDDKKKAETLEKVYNLFPILKQRENQLAGTLSGGEQQMLAVGRGMMGNPKLLLLDEPSMGLAPILVKEVFSLIGRIRDMGVTVLLVEQNAKSALRIADKAFVLETGNLALSGSAKEMLESDKVREAYLGV